MLVSAVRLVHRSLAVTPPAALAVALADHDAAASTDDARALVGDREGGAAVPVDRKLGLEEDPPVAKAAAAAMAGKGKGKGRGRKRGRSEIGVSLDEDGGAAGEEECRRHPSRGGETGSGSSSSSGKGGRTAAEPRPSPSLFVAGRAVAGVATGVDAERGFGPLSGGHRRRRRLSKAATTTLLSASVVGGGEPQAELEWAESSEAGEAREDGGCSGGEGGGQGGWAGVREDSEAQDLCRRVKERLVGLFHRGTTYGCSALVEVCLQVRGAGAGFVG